MSPMKVTRVLAVVSGLSCLGATCNNTRVTIPKDDPTPPVIKISNFASGGSAEVNPPDALSSDAVTGNQKVTVSRRSDKCIPQLVILGSASDPGGVQFFQIVVTDLAPPMPQVYKVFRTQDPIDNQADTVLSILGVDGLTGATLTLTFANGACPDNRRFRVSANAFNFRGVESKLEYDLVGTNIRATAGTCGCPR